MIPDRREAQPAPAHPVLGRYAALVEAHCAVLGIAPPLSLSYAREEEAVTALGGPEAFLNGRFLVGFVPGRGSPGVMFVNEAVVSRMPPGVLPALAAHEVGHAADGLLSSRLALASLLGPLAPWLAEGAMSLRPEIFANRVAAHLVGRSAVLALHMAAVEALGGADPVTMQALAPLHRLPERPSLPLSLRLRRHRNGRP